MWKCCHEIHCCVKHSKETELGHSLVADILLTAKSWVWSTEISKQQQNQKQSKLSCFLFHLLGGVPIPAADTVFTESGILLYFYCTLLWEMWSQCFKEIFCSNLHPISLYSSLIHSRTWATWAPGVSYTEKMAAVWTHLFWFLLVFLWSLCGLHT